MKAVVKHGDHDQLTHGNWADKFGSSIAGSVAKFQDAGGTIETVAGRHIGQEIVNRWRGADWFNRILALRTERRPDSDYYMELALKDGYSSQDVRVAYNKDGLPSGAISVQQSDGEWDIRYLGTLGIVKGAGSALVAGILKDAAAAGVSIHLTSAVEAAWWWENKIGMTKVGREDDREYQITASRVAEIASKL